MKPLQLRTSLALAYTLILSVVLTILGIEFHFALVRQLNIAFTEALEEKSRALHRFLRFNGGAPELAFDAGDPDEAAFIADATRYYQVYDANSGKLLVQSAGMTAVGLHYTAAEIAELRTQTGLRDIQTDTGRLLLSTSIVMPSAGEAYVVQVGEPLAAIDRAVAGFDRLLWFRIIAGIVIAVPLGRWLAGRALAPLSKLAAATRNIGIRTLHDRLTLRGSGDELDQVAGAFNHALSRVESSVGEMRQFSAALAHELRTPIAILRGEAELELTRPLPVEERQSRLVSQIDEYDRLTRLINQLLTLARAEAGEIALAFAPVALGPFAQSVTEQIDPVAAASGVTLTTEVSGDAVIHADAGWLERLLLILLDNAIKFTPEGGRVTVRVERTGTGARLAVSDTGVGIPEEELPRIFERFRRVESPGTRQVTGTGLGLALAQWIAERHQARIEVTSRQGSGTTFAVNFQIAD